MPVPSNTPAWQAVEEAAAKVRQTHLAELFAADRLRGSTFSAGFGDLHLDYSRQRLTDTARDALFDLAATADVSGALKRMMAGVAVNGTENRAALHTACRGTPAAERDVAGAVSAADAQLEAFVHEALAGPFRTAVVLGIGGSELGPALCVDALRDAELPMMAVRFCANADGIAWARATRDLSPAETLLVVVSKSFTTQETALNAAAAKAWLQAELGDGWADHVAVVSANLEATASFGVAPERVFPMWDWVGGRYSLWSAVGLPIALAYGWGAFQDLREGAAVMDAHAAEADAAENLPVLMALLSVWNTVALGYRAEACVPYDTRLQLLVPHLQQLQMESNGKGVTTAGAPVDGPTQPVVFGGIGTNAQHAFFQQLHQGTVAAPVDILLPATPPTDDAAFHDALISNGIAQADALAFGRVNDAAPHRDYPGNRPVSVLLYRDMNTRVLGQLIALYEHKTVAAAALWDINPFDQWGVELGKALSKNLIPVVSGAADPNEIDAPLIAALRTLRGHR